MRHLLMFNLNIEIKVNSELLPFAWSLHISFSLLKQMLEKEQEENRKMKQMLEEKDRRIAELEREVILLNKVSVN